MSELDPARRRSIRSYVLRQGRMSAAQKRAYEGLLARYAIPYAEARLDLAALFGRTAPAVVEVGFGMGETTAAIAQASPGTNYLGIEVHSPGVGSLLKQIEALGLANVRIVQHDAVEVLQHMLPPDSLAGVNVFFPDPWPKKRHHKRRLIQPDFVRLLASRLAPGGLLHVATDWEDYAGHMLAVLSEESLLRNTAPGFALRPASRPLTKFERRGRQLGHGVWELAFQRVDIAATTSQ
jgi:tRNA (guanine-N7-)-methyltransferase